jgi:hypothetical protein
MALGALAAAAIPAAISAGGNILGSYLGSRGSSAPKMQTPQSGGSQLTQGLNQLQRYTPQQQGAINQVLGQATQGLGQQNFSFAPIAQQARENFQTQTIPGLAERFTALGGGAQRSSAFQGALGQAGAGLESNLAALQSQFGLQQQNNLMNLLGIGLTPQFEHYYQNQPSFMQSLTPGIGQGIGAAGTLLPLLYYMSKQQGQGQQGQDQQGAQPGQDWSSWLASLFK